MRNYKSAILTISPNVLDLLILDEVDYMNDADFDSVMIIAGERNDIRTIMSSTPTGRRAKFYEA